MSEDQKSRSQPTRKLRCVAVVMKRDTYRYTGGKQRFKMHYTKTQCTRAAVCGDRLCRQHSLMINPLILERPYYEHV